MDSKAAGSSVWDEINLAASFIMGHWLDTHSVVWMSINWLCLSLGSYCNRYKRQMGDVMQISLQRYPSLITYSDGWEYRPA